MMLSPNIREKFLSFVFQPECFICGESLHALANESTGGAKVCTDCIDTITEPLSERCVFCSAVLFRPNPFGERCANCRDWKPRFQKVFSLGNYHGGLKSTIVEIKRDFHDTKALQLGLMLGEQLDLRDGLKNIDAVVAVPSHWRRKWSRRGFQPSAVMSDGICRSTRLPQLSNVLICSKFVPKQSKMMPNQRISNVRKTFAVSRKARLQDIGILLVDDVMTSGATANECARALLSAGARTVYAAVGARGAGSLNR